MYFVAGSGESPCEASVLVGAVAALSTKAELSSTLTVLITLVSTLRAL